MKVIILRVVPYMEKAAIIKALSEDKIVSFKVNGIYGNKTPYPFLKEVMVRANIELEESKKGPYPKLKSAELISSPLSLDNSLLEMTSYLICAELVNGALLENEQVNAYKLLNEAIDKLKEKKDIPWTMIYFLGKIISESGYSFNVDSCIGCGSKKDIAGVDFVNGGFVCKNCLTPDADTSFSKTDLLLVHHMFKAQNIDEKPDFEVKEEDMINLYSHFIPFLNDNLGFKLKSFDVLIK